MRYVICHTIGHDGMLLRCALRSTEDEHLAQFVASQINGAVLDKSSAKVWTANAGGWLPANRFPSAQINDPTGLLAGFYEELK